MTFTGRVGSEQTSENLVETVLDQLKIRMTFEISECLVLSIIILYRIYFLLKYVVFKTSFDSIM